MEQILYTLVFYVTHSFSSCFVTSVRGSVLTALQPPYLYLSRFHSFKCQDIFLYPVFVDILILPVITTSLKKISLIYLFYFVCTSVLPAWVSGTSWGLEKGWNPLNWDYSSAVLLTSEPPLQPCVCFFNPSWQPAQTSWNNELKLAWNNTLYIVIMYDLSLLKLYKHLKKGFSCFHSTDVKLI